MAVKPVVYDDSTKKHRPLGSGEKMDGLSASSIISADSGNLIATGSDGLAYATGSGIIDPAADNLLEATSGGKVKMDVDRLAEWLDGHPADAKIIADALNVVSGDSGNIIHEGSDGGAYMSSAQLAAAIAGLGAAQLQSLLAAFADGQTIVVSGGKLVVDPTTAPKAKLQAITTALRKAGGGLAVDPDTGKLVVNFGEIVDPNAISDILDSLIDFGGGLAKNQQRYLQAGDKWVDSGGVEHTVTAAQAAETPYGFPNPNYKKLIVDFSKMPNDKFQQLKDSLDMQRTLDRNIAVYVDYDHQNASDTYKVTDPDSGKLVIDKDRGKETKPFQTIKGAVGFATSVYALGEFYIVIYVKPRSNSQAANYPYYKESITLPTFTATSGYIQIRAFDDATPPKICNSSPDARIFSCTGGTWRLRRLKLENKAGNAGSGNHFPVCIGVSGGASVTLYGMELDMRFVLASGETKDEGFYQCRMLTATTGGVLSIRALSGYQTKLTYDKGAADGLLVVHLERNGAMQLPSDRVADIPGLQQAVDSIYAVRCSGVSSTFLSATTQSNFSYIGGSPYYMRFVWAGPGDPSGKRYVISTGSGALVPRTTGTAAGTALPGAEDGTAGEASSVVFDNPPTVAQVREVAESLMGCWYKEGTVSAIPYSS